jgi:hypothetical protein
VLSESNGLDCPLTQATQLVSSLETKAAKPLTGDQGNWNLTSQSPVKPFLLPSRMRYARLNFGGTERNFVAGVGKDLSLRSFLTTKNFVDLEL